MPPIASPILKALSFLGLGWTAQMAIAALPATPEAPKPVIPPVTIIAADPPVAVPTAPAPASTPVAPAPVLPTITETPTPVAADARQVECMAKVVLHEAGAQTGRGQIAVAQVIRARVRSGRFAADTCGVVRQRGQFFDVDAYQPARESAGWKHAVAIATDALTDQGEEVAPGALFFHAVASTRGHGSHQVVAQIGGNVFYR